MFLSACPKFDHFDCLKVNFCVYFLLVIERLVVITNAGQVSHLQFVCAVTTAICL